MNVKEYLNRLASAVAHERYDALNQFYTKALPLAEAAKENLSTIGLRQLILGPVTIGLAVWPWRFDKIRESWNSPGLAAVPAEHHAREFFLCRDEANVDILTADGSGPLLHFLNKNGEGLQQVEFTVRNVSRATEYLAIAGLKPLYNEPRPGAENTTVNFVLLPSSPHLLTTERSEPAVKILVELVQH